MKKFALLFFFSFILFSISYAAIPNLINYEGRLTDQLGAPVTGVKTMSFKICDDPSTGITKWTSNTYSVAVNEGIFNVLLGSQGDPIPEWIFTKEATSYLEVTIAGETLTPRTRIVSIGYAFKAADSDNLGGNSPSYYASVASLTAHTGLTSTAHGGLVSSIAKLGEARLTGNVDLKAGTNVLLSQVGQVIEISSSGGGGGGVVSVGAGKGLIGGPITTTGTLSIDSTVLTLDVSPSKGDILYYSGIKWDTLSPGTNNLFLKSQGPGNDLAWDAASGPMGPQGPTGETGPIGPQGPQGISGEVGPQGIQGIQGLTGPRGLTGEAGLQGIQGIQGIQGPTGEVGLRGLTGEAGSIGPQGPQGIKGATGEAGTSSWVDSAGKVTTSVEVNALAGISVTGTATAGVFSGDGSKLSGIVTTVASSGASPLTGDVTFLGNGDAMITQSGNTITITSVASTGGGTIYGVVAGGGLNGGGTAGTVTLNAGYDNSSVGLNGSNSLEVKNNGITGAKIANGTITGADLAGNISIETTGIVSAAAFYGDGSKLSGVIGMTGEAGPQGIQGIQGPTGEVGLRGLTGEAGPIGPQGPQGISGEAGPQGPQGIQGLTGPQGPTGETGSQGDKGDKGDTGLQGLQGIQGLTGEAGPKGDKGDTGSQGLQGNPGPQGISGEAGPQGPQGIQGIQGIQGPSGEVGLQGPQGLKGATGEAGPQGLQGISGEAGPQGLQGIQGLTGPRGLTGEAGPIGPQGLKGATGEAGTSSWVDGAGKVTATVEVDANAGIKVIGTVTADAVSATNLYGSGSNLTGVVKYVGGGRGLVGGPITSVGTLAVDTGVVVTTSDAQTLTNKTINGSLNTITNVTATTANYATLSGTASSLAITGQVTGDVTYYDGAKWTVLHPSTSGYILKTKGANNAPSWESGGSGTVTQINTGAGLTGGPITTTGIISIDTTSVASLGANNVFSGNNRFTGLSTFENNAYIVGGKSLYLSSSSTDASSTIALPFKYSGATVPSAGNVVVLDTSAANTVKVVSDKKNPNVVGFAVTNGANNIVNVAVAGRIVARSGNKIDIGDAICTSDDATPGRVNGYNALQTGKVIGIALTSTGGANEDVTVLIYRF